MTTTMAHIPLITLEEHSISDACDQAFHAAGGDPIYRVGDATVSRLRDVGDGRVADMDASDIGIQVVSQVCVQNVQAAVLSSSNEAVASRVHAHPTRLRAFAALPMGNPAAAAAELERCITSLEFVGALVDNHTNGVFYDGAEYDVFWGKAEALGVPIYLHPTWPTDAMVQALYSGGGIASGSRESFVLGCGGWGWHAETGLHVVRMLAAGVFDRFPRLKLVIGHSGEMLPFMFGRVEKTSKGWYQVKRDFRTVMHENIWITTSALFDLPSLRCLLATMPLERVLFSVDYPFSSNEDGRRFVEEIEASGTLTGDDLKAFAYGNAEKLLGVKLA